MKNNKIVLASFCTLFSNCIANAAGLQASFDNASSLGLANAGTAALGENATTVSLNPANMFNLQKREVSFGAVFASRRTKFVDQGSSSGAFNNANEGTWRDRKTLYNFYGSYAVNDDFRIGIGIKQPFKREDTVANPWPGSAQEQHFQIESTEVMPAIAYKINNKTSIGGGANWQHTDLKYDRAASTLTAFSLNKNTISFDGSGSGWGWNAGLAHEFTPNFKIGFTYKSAIKYNIKSDINISGPTSALIRSLAVPAYTQFTSPEIWTTSFLNKFNNKLTFVGDISLSRWSKAGMTNIFSTQSEALIDTNLRTELRDSYRAAFGTIYGVNSNLDLKCGYAIEQSPVKSASTRQASFSDGNIHWISAGTTVKFQSTKIDLGFAHSLKNKSRIDNDKRSSNQGLVSGQFKVSNWVIGAQISQAF